MSVISSRQSARSSPVNGSKGERALQACPSVRKASAKPQASAQSRAAKCVSSVHIFIGFEGRVSRPALRGGRDLIQRPSRGKVLSAIGPQAVGEVGVLAWTLEGLDAPVRILAAANCSDDTVCAVAELFTTSRCELGRARLARL